jgi:hypothetical protein
MMGLLRRSSFVKMLGSYPAAATPIEDEVEPKPDREEPGNWE